MDLVIVVIKQNNMPKLQARHWIHYIKSSIKSEIPCRVIIIVCYVFTCFASPAITILVFMVAMQNGAMASGSLA